MTAPVITPLAEAAGEQAAAQTISLTVIEGGASEMAAGGAAAAGIGGAAVATAGVGLILVGLGALAYYLYSRSHSKPKTVEECEKDKKCPPHDWYVDDPGKSLEDGMEEKQKLIENLSKSPSRAKEMRGHQFEKDAIELNGKRRPIESTGRIYKCRRCGAEQSVDINFKDGQLAEAKSRNYNGIKKASKQAQRYTDLQSQLNRQNKTSFRPLAKLDDDLPDSEQSATKYSERGFETERLSTGKGD